MPRCMSFSMTTEAVRNHTKTVTRRVGWDFLKPGDLLWACEKCQGLKKGEKVKRLTLIRVVSKRLESLSELERLSLAEQVLEMRREGFPGITVPEFLSAYLRASKLPDAMWPVNRIEFEYAEEKVARRLSGVEPNSSLDRERGDHEPV